MCRRPPGAAYPAEGEAFFAAVDEVDDAAAAEPASRPIWVPEVALVADMVMKSRDHQLSK